MENKDKWCIKQNTHQDVCDWFNEKFNTIQFNLKGGYKYLINQKEGSYYTDCIEDYVPESFREIELKEFYELTNKLPINWFLKLNDENRHIVNSVKIHNENLNASCLLLDYVESSKYNLNEFGNTMLPPTGYSEITTNQFIQHYVKQEIDFVLPDKWYCVVTEKNKEMLAKWRFPNDYISKSFKLGWVVGYCKDMNEKQSNPEVNDYWINPITTEQFIKYVLRENQTTMKKQTLTRKQLIDLHDSDDCCDWKQEIKEILELDCLADYFTIPQKSIDFLLEDGSDKQKELVRNLGFELPKTQEELYLEEFTKCDLQVGDIVSIKSDELWTGWTNEGNNYVGKIGIIKHRNETNFEVLVENHYCYYFRHYSLKKNNTRIYSIYI